MPGEMACHVVMILCVLNISQHLGIKLFKNEEARRVLLEIRRMDSGCVDRVPSEWPHGTRLNPELITGRQSTGITRVFSVHLSQIALGI